MTSLNSRGFDVFFSTKDKFFSVVTFMRLTSASPCKIGFACG